MFDEHAVKQDSWVTPRRAWRTFRVARKKTKLKATSALFKHAIAQVSIEHLDFSHVWVYMDCGTNF